MSANAFWFRPSLLRRLIERRPLYLAAPSRCSRGERRGASLVRGLMTANAKRDVLLAIASVVFVASCDRAAEEPVTAPAWSVGGRPLLEIRGDGTDGQPVIINGIHATRRADGSVLVVDQGAHALKLFSPAGVLGRTTGRNCMGPGEFEFMRMALRCGDSLYIEGIVLRRVSVHALDGSMVRTMSTLEFGGGVEAFRTACNEIGDFVHHAWNRLDPSVKGRHRAPLPFWGILKAEGLGVAYPAVLGPEYVRFDSGAARALLGRETHIAIGRRRVYVGTAENQDVTVLTREGDPAGQCRLPGTFRAASPADLERAKRFDSVGQDVTTQRETRRVWDFDSPPETLPPYDAMLVDALDHLWVRQYPSAGAERTAWFVFDAACTHVVTVELPTELHVSEVGTNYVLGVQRDIESGEHAVLMLELFRAPASR
jgi:hypothetical protein